MASGSVSSSGSNNNSNHLRNNFGVATQLKVQLQQQQHPRAKLASGVPMLMATVENASCLTSSPHWGSCRYVKKKRKKTVLQKVRRMVLGAPTTKQKAS
jgi:hypothetical protein